VYVLDPKGGQELGDFEPAVGKTIGRMTVKDWGTMDDGGAKRIIDSVHAEMKRRQAELRGQRKWSQAMADEYPLILFPIDEALELMLKIDKDSLTKLLTILSQGRAAGVKVILLSQAAQKSILDMTRTLIAERLALYLEGPTDTGMVFGRMDAENEGARCSEITSPGIGYARMEGQRGYQMFRSYLVEDDDIAATMAKGQPNGMGLGKVEPTELYCVYYYRTSDRQLLYIGITNDWDRRDAEHKADFLKGDPKHYWYQYVDPTKSVVRGADNKAQAKAEETREIKKWKPPGNRAENADNPRQGMEIEAIPHHHFWNRTPKPVDLADLTPTEPEPLPLNPSPAPPPVEEWPLVPEPVDVGLSLLDPEPEPEPVPVAAPKMTNEHFRRTRRDNFVPVNMRHRQPKPARVKVPARQGPDDLPWPN
jgi:predicted GIY-YIG superfamily endonuclease